MEFGSEEDWGCMLHENLCTKEGFYSDQGAGKAERKNE